MRKRTILLAFSIATGIYLLLLESSVVIFHHTTCFIKHSYDSFGRYANCNETNSQCYGMRTYPSSTEMLQRNPKNYKFIIIENDTCGRNQSADVDLLVAVCVAPDKFEYREFIRTTWGALAKSHKNVRLIFMLGTVPNREIQDKILNESKRFHDIVQGNFVDSYRNPSVKMVYLLRWASLHCLHTKYIFKTEADVFVNIPNLLNALSTRKDQRSILGFTETFACPVRDRNSKSYISEIHYNKSIYPEYVFGPGYVISTDIVVELLEASTRIPMLELEDVYITGLCRFKIAAKAIFISGFTKYKPKASGCAFRFLITGHSYSLKEMNKIWSELNDNSLTCHWFLPV